MSMPDLIWPALIGLSAVLVQADPGDIPEPEVLLQGHHEHSAARYSNPVRLPDGELIRYGVDSGSGRIVSQTSSDGARTWSPDRFECDAMPGTYGVVPLVAADGEMHLASLVGRGTGEIAVTRFIDVWAQRTSGSATQWEEPGRIYEGYCGALLDFKQLSTGRLIVPFAWWVPKRPCAPPVGANLCVVYYSDDGGVTWTKSEPDLSAPCYPDFVGNNYGADEPCVLELKDGRLWMLMRTQTGFLYESFSSDQGTTWSEAQPSRFTSSSSPPMLWRMPDDRILILWNDCESPPAHEGQGVYVNRDAIHAAISDDEGKTWRGFREIYRDPLENETPPDTDRGSAYPTVPVMAEGRIVVLTGQGEGRRNLVRLDPRWLTVTHREDDFSDGLGQWIAFKPIGPAKHWRRDRIAGPALVDHPTQPRAKAMHLRKPDAHAPDGAVWNFPNGAKGTLRLRLILNEGWGGAAISLNDRAFKPTDANSRRLAMFALDIAPDGQVTSGPKLGLGAWHELTFAWDLAARACRVSVDGNEALTLGQLNPTGNGISYLHVRSTAEEIDPAGLLIDWARADIADPVAPERTPEQQQALLDRYLPSYYTAPPERIGNAKTELKQF